MVPLLVTLGPQGSAPFWVIGAVVNPRGPPGDDLQGCAVGDSGIFLSSFSTRDWRRQGQRRAGRWGERRRKTQRMKKEKPKHDCRAKPCQWSAKSEGWLRALLAFIHPSFPEQLSTNIGQPSQDTPCKLSLPQPF